MPTPYEVEKVWIELARQEVYPVDDDGKRPDYKERALRLLRVAENVRKKEALREAV